MSLENEIKKNTAALIELTNALAANEKGTTPAPVKEPVQASPAASAPTVPADVLDDAPDSSQADVLGDPPVAEPTGEVIDKKQVIAAVIALAKGKGREAASAFMATYGVAKASEFNDPTKYVEILAALNAATAAK